MMRMREALLFWLFCIVPGTTLSGLRSLNDCFCPDQDVSFECTVIGGELTLWHGNALACQGGEITLLHREFNTSSAMGECNSGGTMISARGVQVVNNEYTSRIDVSLTSTVIGRDIACSSSDGVIDSTTLRISTEPFNPPDVTTSVNSREITFSWNPVVSNCEDLNYSTSVMNCGKCVRNTTIASISCTGFLPSAVGTTCKFSIQTIICGNITGAATNSTINLKVPDAPIIQSIPRYLNGRIKILIGLNTSFNVSEDPFLITNDVDGSSINYTISYADSTFGTICSSEVIPASACRGRVCSHYFDILESSSCPSSTGITVTAYATNILGSGSPSGPVTRDGLNNLVNVNFNATERSIICTFLNQPLEEKKCIANITYGSKCDQLLDVYKQSGTGDTVRTPSLETVPGVAEYCFTVTAISNNVTVQVEGNLVNIGTGESDVNIASIVAPLVVLLALLVLVILIIVTMVLVYWYRRKKSPIVVTIKFAIKDEPGSLAKALKVFKDRHINILGVNTHLHHANFSRIAAKGKKYNHVHCLCSNEDKEYLKSTFAATILEDNSKLQGQQSFNQNDGKNRKYPVTAIITVKDQPGGLWKILNDIGNRGINLLGVNTRSDRESSPGYKDNYVKCSCSEVAIFNVVRDLETIGAVRIKVEVEIEMQRETRAVSYLVPDEVGALSRSLEVFSGLGINISAVNPDHILDVERITSHGFKQNYVECSIDDQKRKLLFEKLKKDYGAVQVELHPVPKEKEASEASQNYCIIKVTNVDEKGALNRILRAFSDLDVNICGVNTLKRAFKREVTIVYKHYHLEIIATDDQETELKEKLQARSLAVDVKPFHLPHADDVNENSSGSNVNQEEVSDPTPATRTIEFKVRNEAGSLMNALQVFSEVGVNITRVNPVHLSCEHQDEYVECSCVTDKRKELIKRLESHGAMKVKLLTKDEAPPRKAVDDPNYCVLKFSVGPKIGAIVEALKAFQALGIRIYKVNPPHIKHQNQYAECYCRQEVQANLQSKLKAINGVLHVGLLPRSEIPSGKPISEPDYCVVKFSVGDEPGTLVRALKVFHELDINIIGVNTLNVAFERKSTVNYKHNHVEYIATPDQESELKMKLQAAGLAVDVKPYMRICKQQPAPIVDEATHFQHENYEMEDLKEN